MSALNLALGSGSVLVNQTVTSWQHAIEIAGTGLINSGRVLPEYSQAMIAAVEELGPYMVIAPGIALAHARPSELVLETGLAVVTLTEGVEFGSERFDPVRIVFALAAKDHESHIDLMAELSELLLDEESITILLSSSEESQVRSLFSQALTMKIIAVCGMGIGTSVLLKMNIEKVLDLLGVKAEVQAADVAKAKRDGHTADIIMTTPELVFHLENMPGQIVPIDHVFDLTEIRQKLSSVLGK